MKHLELTKKHCEFIEEFHLAEKIKFDPSQKIISEAIFYHVFKVKQSQWKQMTSFNRMKRASTADLLQDIIAYYLKATLSDEFTIILEQKADKLQPDILIQYKERNIFLIEVKTTIGWSRGSLDKEIPDRIQNLSNAFNIPISNIIYIFQSPWNVSKSFREKYWDVKHNVPVNSVKLEFPFNQIRPLFSGEDPFYYKQEEINPRYFSDQEIFELAKINIVVPIEKTILEIKTAAEKQSKWIE